ncbi:MAG: hypothetical protein KVP17_003115 [Porospora cf. gigantea B]|uniref:uncharacterized protein n=1 Tax=Porospora cf. gigantea B TaxID=2853592 RepID=UPI003571B2BE|nr:MAG: hypothetical protein KVP17_003115 [Porospora cf. gigantea B]
MIDDPRPPVQGKHRRIATAGVIVDRPWREPGAHQRTRTREDDPARRLEREQRRAERERRQEEHERRRCERQQRRERKREEKGHSVPTRTQSLPARSDDDASRKLPVPPIYTPGLESSPRNAKLSTVQKCIVQRMEEKKVAAAQALAMAKEKKAVTKGLYKPPRPPPRPEATSLRVPSRQESTKHLRPPRHPSKAAPVRVPTRVPLGYSKPPLPDPVRNDQRRPSLWRVSE